MSSPQVDWFSRNAPVDPITVAMGRNPVPHTDWFATNHPAAGPNDPNGNYDFTSVGLGKVTGARMNGHVATRQEAFDQQTTLHGIAQNFANTVQQHQQAMEDFRKSFTTDQMTKDLLGDLATMAVAGGASKLANLGKWAPLASRAAAADTGGDWFAAHAPGIGPGGAHVTDPAFAAAQIEGAHADRLNNFPDAPPGGLGRITFSDVLDAKDKISTKFPITSIEDARQRVAFGKLLDTYRVDPKFRDIADASRQYVHNFENIGDIDKVSLGLKPVHDVFDPELDNPEHLKWDADPDMLMFDGSKFGKDKINYQEGRQIVETLYSAIREAKERNIPLWRGIKGNIELDKKGIGDNLTLPLSSFSDDIYTGQSFARDTLFKLEGPSKHLNIKLFNSLEEGEHLTQGTFEITGDQTKTLAEGKKIRYLTIQQKGVH